MTREEEAGPLALVEKAARAPSSHNTQPWRFRVSADRVELHADRTRALPVNDPDDRELTVSCGTALFNLEVAAAAAGYTTSTTLFPNAQDPDHLATMTLDASATPNPHDVYLASQIAARHTTRGPFGGQPVSARLRAEVADLARNHDTTLVIVDDPTQRRQLAALVAEGDRVQCANARWRRELASWMRPRRKGDGLAMPGIVAPVSRLVVMAINFGRSMARKDHTFVMNAPLLAVLVSHRDSEESWLHTGRALEALLLHAAAAGLQAGYLNQPCQVAELRPRLQHAIDSPGFPQIVLRLGHTAKPRRPSPRRPIEHVLLPSH